MTPRHYLSDHRRLPPCLARWVQPFFSFDVSRVTITIGDCWCYGRRWNALTTNGRIRIDDVYFVTCNTNCFLQTCAAELYHVEQWRRQGPLPHLLGRIIGVFRSRVKGSRYDHRVIPEEREADARRHEVAVFLMARQSELPGMDEEMA